MEDTIRILVTLAEHADTLSTLLLPRDPVANAPALIQALATAFPAKRGSYLLGLLARITWFTPPSLIRTFDAHA